MTRLAVVRVAAMAGLMVAGILIGPRMQAQSNAPAAQKFDVVSIKPCQDPREQQNPGGTYPPRGNSSPGRLRTGCYPLLDEHGMGLIRAFTDNPFTPIHGGPSWIHSAFYQIDAIADGSPSVKTMMGPMMQALLEDRFHLKIHRETSEGPVYVLSAARGGAKLHPYTEGSCKRAMQPDEDYCRGLISAGLPASAASVDDRGATLDGFSRQLRAVLDRPVLNQTNIAGRFDLHVDFSREGTKFEDMYHIPPVDGGSRVSDPTGLPTIFTALQEQLGLKLEPGKGPVDLLVIDAVEKPSEN